MPQTVVITCRYCGTGREVPAYYAQRYSTCGSADCKARRTRDRAAAAKAVNTGKKHSPEVNASKGRPSRPQSPEHVANRTAARKAKGAWFQIPDIGERISKGHDQRKAEGRFYSTAGNKNGMWRGGVSKLPDGNRSSVEYRNWKLAVLERDAYACQRCGGTKNVIAHHIQGWYDAPHLRIDPDNGLSLCRGCHMIVHGFTHDSRGRFAKDD